jgi:hypothetical protein
MKQNITFTVPQGWNDITIEMYQKFLDINKKGLSSEQLGKKVICVLCGVNSILLNKFRTKDIARISKDLLKWIAQEPPKQELEKRVVFNNVSYGMIPNLSTITLGEFVDLDNYCKDGAKNFHKVMSVLYRPIVEEKGEMYSIEHYNPNEDREREFLDFPILTATSALHFFFALGKKLQKNIHNSLKKKMVTKQDQ